METSIFSAALSQTDPALLLGSQPRPEYFEPHWYATYTCANHEKRVAQQLQQSALLVGIAAGLGLLSKYAMAYWLLSALLYLLLFRDERRHLPRFLGAAALLRG